MAVIQLNSVVATLTEDLNEIFRRIYHVHISPGNLDLPDGIKPWVTQRFGHPSIVEGQTVVRVDNRITLEGTLYNELRSMRPLEKSSGQDLTTAVEGYKYDCPFCRAGEQTPRDVFGRIEGQYCITAANIAKYDGWHGLVIPREHHPLRFNLTMLQDYLDVAGRWFTRVMAEGEKAGAEPAPADYCFLMWNCLWPAGSSVVHGHLQLTVTRGGHYPAVERLRRSAMNYKANYGSNYFEDLYRLHLALGLGLEFGQGIRVMAVLTPVKEREVWLMAPVWRGVNNLNSLAPAVYRVLRVYLDQLGVNSYNMAVYLPPEGETREDWRGFPTIVRIVDRGDAMGRTADFGGMELFAASVVASDPFAVATTLRDALTAQQETRA